MSETGTISTTSLCPWYVLITVDTSVSAEFNNRVGSRGLTDPGHCRDLVSDRKGAEKGAEKRGRKKTQTGRELFVFATIETNPESLDSEEGAPRNLPVNLDTSNL